MARKSGTVAVETLGVPVEQTTPVQPVAQPPVQSPQGERISPEDARIFELSQMNVKLTRSNAEKAIAEHNASDMQHRYITLQLFTKYQLNLSTDQITEAGEIVRGTNRQG